jgi:hypothetical protein
LTNRPSTQTPSVVLLRLSRDTSTENVPSPFSTTVMHAPDSAIEAPIATSSSG